MDLLDAEGYEERERKEGADNATGRLDNVDWCNHARAVRLCGLSMYVSCHPRRPRITSMSAAVDVGRNAIA